MVLDNQKVVDILSTDTSKVVSSTDAGKAQHLWCWGKQFKMDGLILLIAAVEWN